MRCVRKGHCLSAASLSFLYTFLAKYPPLRYPWLRNRENFDTAFHSRAICPRPPIPGTFYPVRHTQKRQRPDCLSKHCLHPEHLFPGHKFNFILVACQMFNHGFFGRLGIMLPDCIHYHLVHTDRLLSKGIVRYVNKQRNT